MKRFACAAILIVSTATAFAKEPDCAGPENWAPSMVFVHMKNAGLVTNNQIDFGRTKVSQISRERIGLDLWRQVLFVQYRRKDGSPLDAISVSDISREECSMGPVQVYVVSRTLPPAK